MKNINKIELTNEFAEYAALYEDMSEIDIRDTLVFTNISVSKIFSNDYVRVLIDRLNSESDENVVNFLKNILFLSHKGYIEKMADKFSTVKVDYDELFSEGSAIFCHALSIYDTSNIFHFYQYLTMWLDSKLRQYVFKNLSGVSYPVDSLKNNLLSDNDIYTLSVPVEIEKCAVYDFYNVSGFIEPYIKLFKSLNVSDRNIDIFKLKFGEHESGIDYTYEEIASIHSITRQRVCQILFSLIKMIKSSLDDISLLEFLSFEELSFVSYDKNIFNKLIYEEFSEFNREDVNYVVNCLQADYSDLLFKRYGVNFFERTKIDKSQKSEFKKLFSKIQDSLYLYLNNSEKFFSKYKLTYPTIYEEYSNVDPKYLDMVIYYLSFFNKDKIKLRYGSDMNSFYSQNDVSSDLFVSNKKSLDLLIQNSLQTVISGNFKFHLIGLGMQVDDFINMLESDNFIFSDFLNDSNFEFLTSLFGISNDDIKKNDKKYLNSVSCKKTKKLLK